MIGETILRIGLSKAPAFHWKCRGFWLGIQVQGVCFSATTGAVFIFLLLFS
jgi:hypothetical protein